MDEELKPIDYVTIAVVIIGFFISQAGYKTTALVVISVALGLASLRFYQDGWTAGLRAIKARSASKKSDFQAGEDIVERAAKQVRHIIEALPADLKEQASRIPTLLMRGCEQDGESFTFGRYVGFQSGQISDEGGPIVLYLGSILKYCQEHQGDFDEEVRTTYLHEFGHHLGWDEDEVEKRGL